MSQSMRSTRQRRRLRLRHPQAPALYRARDSQPAVVAAALRLLVWPAGSQSSCKTLSGPRRHHRRPPGDSGDHRRPGGDTRIHTRHRAAAFTRPVSRDLRDH